MFTIELNNQSIQNALREVVWAVGDLAPLIQGIAAELAQQTEENFKNEGRPEWAELSDTTTERRAKHGNWPGQFLQVSAAGLAASITTHASHSSALVGSNKPYAAMMQFGGEQADFQHLWGDIPSRPYLPMTTSGELQPEAEHALLELALSYLEHAVRS